MPEKNTPDKMLMRLMRVAEILAKAEAENQTNVEEVKDSKKQSNKSQDAIQRALLEDSGLPIYNEYVDNLSGHAASNRTEYQRMLEDARTGLFSFVAVENAERFGRNDTEALTAIDELHTLGISVRFADYPDLDPIDPDDRILVSLSFTLARRESIKLGQRAKGGMHAKMQVGGFIGVWLSKCRTTHICT
jgi:DNA invertase Pin-like site-specific DNA recombinase